ncbi:MAG: FAD-dependent monooxygenase [Bacteroidetes bacterium]|nr:FAD-dependent monooxygenase [Bacteroidota bacterium]
MMIALPNPAGDFTLTLFLAHQGNPGFDHLKTKESVIQFFEQEFPDALPLMPTLVDDFFENPIGSLVTVKCYPWVRDGKIALMGDAAHAVVPFFGQGMNCSFEDCVVLDECIEKYSPNWDAVFSNYQLLRKPNADAIADLAVQNFYEMADKVGDAEFLHRKHIEHDLCEFYSDIFKSQYELVTFSTVPYSEAKARGAVNDKIIDEIIAGKLEGNLKDNNAVLQILEKYLAVEK